MPAVNDIRDYKSKLREKCKAQRLSLTSEKKRSLDSVIAGRLLNSQSYKSTNILLVYVSKGIEIDTIEIIENARKDGKRIVVPYCRTDTTDLDFYYISSLDDLSPGTFGVLEPDPAKSVKFEEYDRGLCIVPALCYDMKGYRLGFGKGYFDRFLARYSGATVGIGYSFQIKRSLWHGRYDRPVDQVITDRNIISCGEKSKTPPV